MNRFGIARWEIRLPSAHVTQENGYEGQYIQEHAANGAPPLVLYYHNADYRDAAMKDLVMQYPGLSFVPFEVSEVQRVTPGDIVVCSVSADGVLPK